MSYLHDQELIGKILAITALSLAPPCTLLGRHYSRTLYFTQILFLFSSAFKTTANSNFSMTLGFSWLSFVPSFITRQCTPGSFLCDYGYLLSPGLVWLGGAVVFLLLFKAVACKMENLQFLKFYAFYRGFFHWFMGPLVYFSTSRMIKAIQLDEFDVSFTSAVIVLGVLLLIVILELVSAQVAQQQDPWQKWIYFFGHVNVAAMMVSMAVFGNDSKAQIAKYMLNIPLGLYMLVFLLKYNFMFKTLERVGVFLQDAIIITCYNIFANNYVDIANTNIDFFALVVVGGIELIFLLLKLGRFLNPPEPMNSAGLQKDGRGQADKRRHGDQFNHTYQQLVAGRPQPNTNPTLP